jgi:hypothetical protein
MKKKFNWTEKQIMQSKAKPLRTQTIMQKIGKSRDAKGKLMHDE